MECGVEVGRSRRDHPTFFSALCASVPPCETRFKIFHTKAQRHGGDATDPGRDATDKSCDVTDQSFDDTDQSCDVTDKSFDETDPSGDFWESSAVDAGCTALSRVKTGTIGAT